MTPDDLERQAQRSKDLVELIEGVITLIISRTSPDVAVFVTVGEKFKETIPGTTHPNIVTMVGKFVPGNFHPGAVLSMLADINSRNTNEVLAYASNIVKEICNNQ